MKSTAGFPTVVSSSLLYSGQDVVSFPNGHLAEPGAAGLMFESLGETLPQRYDLGSFSAKYERA